MERRERRREREKEGERRQKTKSRGTNWGSVTGAEVQRGGKGTVAKADGRSEPSRSEAEIRSLGRRAQSIGGGVSAGAERGRRAL